MCGSDCLKSRSMALFRRGAVGCFFPNITLKESGSTETMHSQERKQPRSEGAWQYYASIYQYLGI